MEEVPSFFERCGDRYLDERVRVWSGMGMEAWNTWGWAARILT